MDRVLVKRMNSPLGQYLIYSDGRVYSEKSNKFLSCDIINSGYKLTKITHDGKCYHCLIHRLVAEYFVTKHEGCNVVNHLDGNRLNNDYRNLEWTTQKGNLLKAQMSGVSPDRQMNPYEIYCPTTDEAYLFSNLKAALIYTGVNPGRYCYNEILRRKIKLPESDMRFLAIQDTDWYVRLRTDLSVADYTWEV